jgi:PhnB protein
MASTLNPYLSFRDDARAAMEFYQAALGGELTISTFSEFGDADAPEANLVMHSQLTTPSGFTLMGSDTPPGMEFQEGGRFSISLSGDDEAELRGYFDKLSEGGTVTMPLEKQMWGDVFGMVTDPFGVGWMVNIAGETQG